MSFVIFDTEYTTWKGCQEHGWHGAQKRELVQLAALKVGDDLQVLDELNIYFKPVINPVLSDYFIELSGITNEFIQKNGTTFLKGYQKFKDFVGKDLCLSFAWGQKFDHHSDGVIIQENIKLNNLSPDSSIKYHNIAWWFEQVFLKHNISIQTINSGKIAKFLGQDQKLYKLGLNEHNAFYDVYSILIGIQNFQKDWGTFLRTKKL